LIDHDHVEFGYTTAMIRRAEAARLRLTGEFARALGVVVGHLRLPLLAVSVLPLAPAALLLIGAAVVGGRDGLVLGGLAVVGLVPSAWLFWRRHRMTWAVTPVDALADELLHAFDVSDAWGEVNTGLAELKEIGRRGRGPVGLGRGAWHGLRLALRLLGRVTELPRVEPFTPVRLQTTVYIGVACVASAVLMFVVALVTAVLGLIGAL
jgi:hypothetical protein